MAQPTPSEPRLFIAPDASGTATGTPGADDIYAAGPGETLIGNSGDDIFHIGTNTDAVIVETKPGISAVETWASTYTLPAGVDNLLALGDYSHVLEGNAGANFITASAGDDTLIGGTGDTLAGGAGQDVFVVENSDGAETIADMHGGPGGDVIRLVDTGWTSFAQVQAHMSDLPSHGAPQPTGVIVMPSGNGLILSDFSVSQLTAENFAFDNSGATPSPSPTPSPGSTTLKVFASEDAFAGDAQFTVDVDGVQVGGPTGVTTLHSSGAFQELDFTVPLASLGAHTVAIHFVNDAWGGTPATDRNLYIQGIDFGGNHFAGQTAQNDADLGLANADPNAAEMFINGTVTFAGVAAGGLTIAGTDGPDTLTGTPGDDTIVPLKGNDSITGGGGTDTVVFHPGDGVDQINDFQPGPGGDIVDLTGFGFTSFDADVRPRLSAIAQTQGTVLDLPNGDAVDFPGADGTRPPSAFTADNFVFHGPTGPVVSGQTIVGTVGNDQLGPTNSFGFTYTGNGGHDTFNLSAWDIGHNTITDFTTGSGPDADVVHLFGSGIYDFAGLQARLSAVAGATLLTLYGGSDILFQGDAPGQFTAADFILDNAVPSPSPPSAVATPAEPRGFIGPDASGVAHGTPGADDIFAAGPGETLIGNGGDDVFHIGTNTDALIQEVDPGTSTVESWATSYALPAAADNLTALGDYAHTLVGNGAANTIVGSSGNDAINGKGGGDLLAGGGGHDTFVIDTFGSNAVNHIADFDPGDDLLDLRALFVPSPSNFNGPVADPLHDGIVTLLQTADGGTEVVYRNGDVSAGGGHATFDLVTLDHVAPTSLGAANFLFH